MKNGFIVGLALLGCTALPVTAKAETITFNNLAIVGGTLTFGNVIGTSTTTVSGAPISFVQDLDTAVSDTITGGSLSIGTGTLTSINVANANDVTYTYSSVGSSLSISGSGTSSGSSGNLLTSAFTGDVFLQFNPIQKTGSLSGTLIGGSLNPDLAAYFGVFPGLNGGSATELYFRIVFSGGSGTATINSSAVNVVATPIPEPGTMLLFGGGLLGLGGAVRRRFFSARV